MITKNNINKFWTINTFKDKSILYLDDFQPEDEMSSYSIEIPFSSESSKEDTLTAAANELSEFFSTSYPGEPLFYFIANATDQPNTRVVKYYGYTKSLDTRRFNNEGLEGDEWSKSYQSDYGIRFAALIKVSNLSNLEAMIDEARQGNAMFILSGNRSTNELLDEVFTACYGEETPYLSKIDWKGLLNYAVSHGNVLTRVSGEFDDPDLGIDIFVKSKDMK